MDKAIIEQCLLNESIYRNTLLRVQLEDNNPKKRFTDSIYTSLS